MRARAAFQVSSPPPSKTGCRGDVGGISPIALPRHKYAQFEGDKLTEVLDAVAGLVQRAGVELEADDGEDEDGEHDEEGDLHERRQRLEDGLQHDLQTCGGSTEGREGD